MCIVAAGKSSAEPWHLAQPVILPSLLCSQVSPFLDNLTPAAFKCFGPYLFYFMDMGGHKICSEIDIKVFSVFWAVLYSLL